MSTTTDLPDLNVWLALTWPAHIHHQHAVQYWEQQAADQVLFCTVTALGLVRLVCQPKLMGTAVRNAAEASVDQHPQRCSPGSLSPRVRARSRIQAR